MRQSFRSSVSDRYRKVAKLDAKLEIVSEKKAELEEEAAELDGILNVIDKIIDSTEVEY